MGSFLGRKVFDFFKELKGWYRLSKINVGK